MMQGINVTYKIAVDAVSRSQFVTNGTLDDQEDNNSRPISQSFPVFAMSRDFGTIQSTQAPVVWAVGYTTDPAVNYTDLSGAPPKSRSLYYKTKYSTDEALASIDDISCGGNMSNIISPSRSLTFSTILTMHPQRLNSWTTRYSRMLPLCRICLETWSLSRSPKYMVAPS
jgi:hypothetical protein